MNEELNENDTDKVQCPECGELVKPEEIDTTDKAMCNNCAEKSK